MIVGRGLLANAFSSSFALDDGILVFASGVSNSSEHRAPEFVRERDMLVTAINGSHQTVYFSSCAVANPHQPVTPYFSHKLEMEKLVIQNEGIVFRLPQVVGRSANPNTLTNFLFDRIRSGEPFDLWTGVERNLIDIDDVAIIATALIRRGLVAPGATESIATPRSVTMLEIVNVFEEVVGKKAIYAPVEKQLAFPIESELCQTTAHELGIQFNDSYLRNLIAKYYSSESA